MISDGREGYVAVPDAHRSQGEYNASRPMEKRMILGELRPPTDRTETRHCPCHHFFRASGPRGGFHPLGNVVYAQNGWDWRTGSWYNEDEKAAARFRTVSTKKLTERMERRREELACKSAATTTARGPMETDGGHAGGLEHSRHAPPPAPAPPPPPPPPHHLRRRRHPSCLFRL